MSHEIAVCEDCGIRRPVCPADGRCIVCRDRAGLLKPDLDGAAVAADGGDAGR